MWLVFNLLSLLRYFVANYLKITRTFKSKRLTCLHSIWMHEFSLDTKDIWRKGFGSGIFISYPGHGKLLTAHSLCTLTISLYNGLSYTRWKTFTVKLWEMNIKMHFLNLSWECRAYNIRGRREMLKSGISTSSNIICRFVFAQFYFKLFNGRVLVCSS